ncbi:hypothetical protein fNO16879116_0004 [Vibrio phage NO16-like 87-9-116]|nr:hypothetical protein fNO16879116_0004 [Vibrio phage NO16-like 87-9-116]
MIIRDVKFTEIKVQGFTSSCAIIRCSMTQDNVFDDCYISEVSGGAIFTNKGVMTFSSDASLYDLYLQFRKQDEAPEMGADSSLKLCVRCKNTLVKDNEQCPECKWYANVECANGEPL